MKKVNSSLYNKIILQAEEAKQLGMSKLASDALLSIGSFPEEEIEDYSHEEMTQDIHSDLWKSASKIFNYYNIKDLDIETFNKVVEACASDFISRMEKSLNKTAFDSNSKEPKVIGQE